MRRLDAWFGISQAGSTVSREVGAGAVTFLTLCYILFVQPAVMAEAGMDRGGVLFDLRGVGGGVLSDGRSGQLPDRAGARDGAQLLLRVHDLRRDGVHLAAGAGRELRGGCAVPGDCSEEKTR